MNKFEVVSAYADKGINIPTRATYAAAGYDFEVAEDIVVPAMENMSFGIAIPEPVSGLSKERRYQRSSSHPLLLSFLWPHSLPLGSFSLSPSSVLNASVLQRCLPPELSSPPPGIHPPIFPTVASLSSSLSDVEARDSLGQTVSRGFHL